MSTSEGQKSKLLKYTIVALSILTAVAVVPWGYTPVLLVLISVAVAVAIEYALSRVSKRFPRSILSAVVFGQIVALSYTLANTNVWTFGYYLTPAYEPEVIPQTAPMAYAYVAIISAVGEVVFRKLQGLLKRKIVNAAAAAKLLVFLPFLQTVLLAQAHKDSLLLAGAVGYNYNPASPSLASAFGPLVAGCFGYFPTRPNTIHAEPVDVFQILAVLKYHGWVGGASAIAVIVVGLALFILARKYIKWRTTAGYFAGILAMSAVMFGVFGGDFLLRLGFELFIGSSIFFAFFMITDPATTPNGHAAQVIFGVGVAVLTVLIQTFMGFLGGSILALVIMNLTVPLLDRIKTRKTKPATV
ncbi:MAG: RnfABCDGE type electron transport complex subunit D [Candidatus Bathyarchaeia archaeon]